MAGKKDVDVKAARVAHKKNADRFAKAVEAEKAAARAAESGEQMARLAAFEALAELS